MMFIGLFWVVVLLLLFRWVLPSESGRALPEDSRRVQGELERLREEVDRLSGQVQRLVDEQSFLLRLLDERETPRALGRGESDAGDPPPPDRQPTH